MAIRPIDANELLGIERLLDTDVVRQSKTASWLLDQVLHDIQAMPTLTPPNEPLSTEQLREMDGEPVWIANPDALGYGSWGIVDGVYQAEDDQVLMLRGDYSCHYYGKTWLAYRRPPEGEA